MLEALFFVHLLVQLVSQGWNLRHLGREAISSLPFGPLGWAFSKLPQNYFFLLLCMPAFPQGFDDIRLPPPPQNLHLPPAAGLCVGPLAQVLTEHVLPALRQNDGVSQEGYCFSRNFFPGESGPTIFKS